MLQDQEYDERFRFHFASEYLDRGWSLIPLAGKRPTVSWKDFQVKRATLANARIWFGIEANREVNVGIVTGRISGLVIVDCDSNEDADYWEANFPASPLVVDTGRGGSHFYYQYPDDHQHINNRVRLFGRAIDLRAEGGYVVAPPSRHPNGQLYAWRHFGNYCLSEVPEFSPAWIPDERPKLSASKLPAEGSIRNAPAYIKRIFSVSGSGGHNAAYRATCVLRDAGYSPEEALSELVDWNESNANPKWSITELLHKVQSAFKRSQ